jgi:6-phosphogluconolactonase (cycloisomerase 2 family)
VYTNNNRIPNSISAFSVANDGSLTVVAGSPFLTGGNGVPGNWLFGVNAITTAVVKNFLYAANAGTNTVSAFTINEASGVLTPVPGSPFATDAVTGVGISLATTPDSKFLFAANGVRRVDQTTDPKLNTMTVYSIADNGALKPVAGSPFPLGVMGPPFGIKVTPDGKFVAVAFYHSSKIAIFSISRTGGLTPVMGSPFSSESAISLDCNCASNRLYSGRGGSTAETVDVLSIAANGALSPISGSPFTGPGLVAGSVALSPDDSKLFVSNQLSGAITVFAVASDGSLTTLPGSPFAFPGSYLPPSLATNKDGTLLYATSVNGLIGGFSVGPNGSLAGVPGSPVSNGLAGELGLFALTVYPAKNCCPAPGINGGAAIPETLWPVNHNLVNVTLDYDVTGPCSHSCSLLVSSNEVVNGRADGSTSQDWEVIDARHVRLRAERAGNASDRVYTITITCKNDVNEMATTKAVMVVVPHDQHKSMR